MGTITYNIRRGTPRFTATLSPLALPAQTHDARGEYSFESVPAGAYDLTVEDCRGCIFTIENIVIT